MSLYCAGLLFSCHLSVKQRNAVQRQVMLIPLNFHQLLWVTLCRGRWTFSYCIRRVFWLVFMYNFVWCKRNKCHLIALFCRRADAVMCTYVALFNTGELNCVAQRVTNYKENNLVIYRDVSYIQYIIQTSSVTQKQMCTVTCWHSAHGAIYTLGPHLSQSINCGSSSRYDDDVCQ